MVIKKSLITEKPNNSRNKYIKGKLTQIDVLDKLLGYDEFERSNVCLDPRSIFVIRGEPGAGKTTLGLQILSKNLEKLRINDHDSNNFIFFSLESDPVEVLNYAKIHYGFFPNEEFNSNKGGHIQLFSAAVIESIIQFATKEIDKPFDEFFKKCTENLKDIMEGKFVKNTIKIVAILARTLLSKLTDKKLKENLNEKIDKNICYSFIFIDTLNVLIQLIQKTKTVNNISDRLLLNIIFDTMRELFKDSIIILTSEYHYQDVTKQSVVSESFFCDIEIALFTEPVVVPSNYVPKFESPLGSNVLSLVTQKVKSIQTQSFCRVLKSRRTPNQSRRCAYEIVSGRGIEFYETYPGDGNIVLFAENDRQNEIWNVLFNKDLPLLYPALRHDSFDRSSLQRTSAAQRRFRYVPPRVDMYLTSFDNYWINWYSELCLKSNAADILQQELAIIEDFRKNKELLILLNEICAGLTRHKDLIAFQQKIYPKVEEFFKFLINMIYNYTNDNAIPKELNDMFNRISLKLQRKDTFEDFMSGLFDVLARIELLQEKRENVSNANSPCLQCLWCRNLIRQLHEKLECSNKTQIIKQACNTSLIRFYKDVEGSDNKELVISSTIHYENKLKEIISNTILRCIECLPKKCADTLKLSSQFIKNLDDFLDTSINRCDLRTRLKYFLWEFVLDCFIVESAKNKGNFREEIQKQIKDAYDNLEQKKISISQNIEFIDWLKPFFFGMEAFLEKLLQKLENSEVEDLLGSISIEFEDSFFNNFFSENLINMNKRDIIKQYPDKLNNKDRWLIILASIFYDVVQGPARYRLIASISADKLRLFGERKSAIISELENHNLVHRFNKLITINIVNKIKFFPMMNNG